MNRNIELKARLRDPAFARAAAERMATGRLPDERQVDTYFHCRSGRLKLRQIHGRAEAQLIWYHRSDEPAARASDYEIVRVVEPDRVREMLSAALGVRGVVDKQRTIFLYQNVRIHLDEVAGLGPFIEFEAVLGSPAETDSGHARVAQLMETFRLVTSDLMTKSYGEMAAPAP